MSELVKPARQIVTAAPHRGAIVEDEASELAAMRKPPPGRSELGLAFILRATVENEPLPVLGMGDPEPASEEQTPPAIPRNKVLRNKTAHVLRNESADPMVLRMSGDCMTSFGEVEGDIFGNMLMQVISHFRSLRRQRRCQ